MNRLGRRAPDLVRTTTSFYQISPFLTAPRGVACFTEATITSPMLANLRPEPPRTLIVKISRAPRSSATFKRVSVESFQISPFSLIKYNNSFFTTSTRRKRFVAEADEFP